MKTVGVSSNSSNYHLLGSFGIARAFGSFDSTKAIP